MSITYSLLKNKNVLRKVKAFEVHESTRIILIHSRKTC
jgi:hypothetical protein